MLFLGYNGSFNSSSSILIILHLYHLILTYEIYAIKNEEINGLGFFQKVDEFYEK